tara:strand:- start:9530 stop:10642 length:1113 start_codon:yes stop_codon:yes gene_type:complete
MLQNKIYQNYFLEIIKTFLMILFGLSLIALTIRAVNFLDLIVESGYPLMIYFGYSFLNLFGIAPKFIPFSFLLALTIFILKHINDSEFTILWTAGVKKVVLVNLLFYSSLVVLIFYLLFSTFLTPLLLNKSRQLLTYENFNSFLPTVKAQQFSDSFKGFTFIVGKKYNNELENIFLFDAGNNLKNLSSNKTDINSTTIIASNGIVDQKNLILINGQVITTNKENKNEMLTFKQLNINLSKLSSVTIKKNKIQETSTLKLIKCFFKSSSSEEYCNENFLKEIMPTLNRRFVTPFYIPVIALISAFLLIKSNKIIFNKNLIFFYSFSILLFTEIAVKFTGHSIYFSTMYITLPIILILLFYFYLKFKVSKLS